MMYELPMDDEIFGGSYPQGQELRSLWRFRSVFDFTRPWEKWWRSLPDYSTHLGSKTQYRNVPLRAGWMPPKKRMTTIISKILGAPRPTLIHCYHGRDRTGMVAAILLIKVGYECERAIEVISERSGAAPKRSLYLDYIRQFIIREGPWEEGRPPLNHFPKADPITESELGKVIDEVEGNIMILIWGEDRVIIQTNFPGLPIRNQVYPFNKLDDAMKMWGEQTYLFYSQLCGETERRSIRASHDHMGVFRRQISRLNM